MSARALAALLLICVAEAAAAQSQSLQPRGTVHEVVFTQYSPLFSNAEILRRLLSPLAAAQLHDTLARTHEVLEPYPLDLTKERFLVYVPAAQPPSPRGFALLVFVSPWSAATLPEGWASRLEQYGVIFVTPAGAENSTAPMTRRVPLALIAEENLVRDYPVDRERIYVGGFSGGSRVALRTALGYPDVFRGALLNAGADPLGGLNDPLPPPDLFLRFQSSTHLVYVTGVLDTRNLSYDAESARSMQDWCAFDVETHETAGEDHQEMGSAAFGRALARLLEPPRPPDPTRLGACRARKQEQLLGKLTQAEMLISQAKHSAARKLLLDIDEQFGGLAAPRILQLAQSCGCGLAAP